MYLIYCAVLCTNYTLTFLLCSVNSRYCEVDLLLMWLVHDSYALLHNYCFKS